MRAPPGLVRILLAAASFGLGLLVCTVGRRWARSPGATWLLPREDEQIHCEDRAGCVVDPVVGHRNQRGQVVWVIRAPMLRPLEEESFLHETDVHGFVRSEPLPRPLTSPRVLLLGDSHVWGVVPSEANASTLLEHALRAEPSLEGALVLNAGTAYYSLHQYALRARTLMGPLSPDVVVVVVFAGNDFIELLDRTRPHLDASGAELPPGEPVLSRRALERLERFDAMSPSSTQGLGQASWIYAEREDLSELRSLTEHALRAIVEATAGTALVLAVIPSFDLVFPVHAARRGPYEREVVRSGCHGEWYAWFLQSARSMGIEVVDLLPVFREDRAVDLYARDYHLYRRGHELLAAELLEPVRAALTGEDG